MHLPYPPRKSSNPAPFLPRASNSRSFLRDFSLPRRYQKQAIVLATFFCIALILLLARGGSSKHSHGGPVGTISHVPSGKPPTVIVTVMDEGRFGSRYTELIKENRKMYADKHGYGVFFPHVGDYNLNGAPMSWTKVVAMRHALTEFPDAKYFWFIDLDTFIMNPHLVIENDVMTPAKLEEKMIVDHPVVPPDSIIHTFSHLHGEDIDFVLTQDKEGLVVSSFVIKNSEWSRFFLETWFDPIYRSYNFQKAEKHALEHIVQWHPTILSKLALLPQQMLNSYNKPDKGREYQTGDLVVRFPKCMKSQKNPNCEKDAEAYTSVWRTAYRNR